jgi:hypothetical protein
MAGRGSVPREGCGGRAPGDRHSARDERRVAEGGWGGGEILVMTAARGAGGGPLGRRRGETRGGETFGISLRKVRGGRQRKGATIPRNKAQRNTGEEEEGGAREGAESAG